MFNSQIQSKFDLEMADLSLVPACRQMAVSWLGQMAISFAVGSFVDDFLYHNKGQEMRDEKRVSLTHVLSFCMDNGYTAQAAHDEIAGSIEKVAETDFKAKSFSEEQLEILLACGEEEEDLRKTLAEENSSASNIHERRRNKLQDFIGDIRGQMEHMLSAARGLDSAGHDAKPWLIDLVATKIQMAEEQHRRYLIRGITQGHLGNAGQLTILNNIIRQERMEAIHREIEELKRESQFDESGVITRGRAGDDENVDITY